MSRGRRRLLASALLLAATWVAAWMQPTAAAFLGHGGPVKGLALTADGERMVSVSFDYSVIVWRLADGAALDIRHGHDAAVNAVVMLPGDAGFATGGDDGAVLLWAFESAEPVTRLDGHSGRVVDLAVSADGRFLASAGWDRTVRVWNPASGALGLELDGHGGPVNALAFTPDGERLVTAGADGALRLFRVADGTQLAEWSGGSAAVHALAVDAAGETVFAAGAAGELQRFRLDTGEPLAGFAAGVATPLFALALGPRHTDGGALLAVTGMDGAITLFDTATGAVETVLGGERSPLWSLAIATDGRTLYAGGNDRTIRRFDLVSGLEIEAPAALLPADDPATTATATGTDDDLGAVVWRRCVACHTLEADGGNRAGPTLHGIFGRPIGAVAGYPYSPALSQGDIVWSEATVAELFRKGPDVVTPGTKMPIQRITDAAELEALIAFLGREAMPGE